MPEIRLVDFVLLSCEFTAWPGDEGEDSTEQPEEDGETSASDKPGVSEAFQYPEGDFLELEVGSSEFDEDYVVVLTASIDDESFPFRIKVVVGSRFLVTPDETGIRPSLEETEATLVWLSYPYLRETVSAISGRSPLPPYILPAITRMPHPSVTEDE